MRRHTGPIALTASIPGNPYGAIFAALLTVSPVLSARTEGQGTRPAVRFTSARAVQPVPRISLLGANTQGIIGRWPGVAFVVDRDAYVVIFAVTRTRNSFALQVLAPGGPRETAFVRGGERRLVRALNAMSVAHLVRQGETPIVLAFASRVAPDLAQFDDGGSWGYDLMVGGAAGDPRALARMLAIAMYHDPDVAYDLVIPGLRSSPSDTRAVASELRYTDCDMTPGRYTVPVYDRWDVVAQSYGAATGCALYQGMWWPRAWREAGPPAVPPPTVPPPTAPPPRAPVRVDGPRPLVLPRLPRPADLPSIEPRIPARPHPTPSFGYLSELFVSHPFSPAIRCSSVTSATSVSSLI